MARATGAGESVQMSPTAAEAKTELRRSIRVRLQTLTPEARSEASTRACARLQEEGLWREAASMLLYAPAPDELNVWPLVLDALRRNKVVALPRFDAERNEYLACKVTDLERDLQVGRFGLQEPSPSCAVIPINRLDFVAVPGVAFTLDGHRLGRGKGFYDRLLTAVRGIKCGVGFNEQIVSAIPTEPHDVRLDCILTPTHWRRTGPSAVLK